MTNNPDIRDVALDDLAAIEGIYCDAFPDEDLRPLVRALLQDTPDVLSLVASADSVLVGHIVFTPCRLDGAGGGVALLGPLAVKPAFQRRGIGSALICAGLDRLRAGDFDQVFVLGDPAYYARFGFEAETLVATPFPLPDEWREAWQSLMLRRSAPRRGETLEVPPAWNEPALWAP